MFTHADSVTLFAPRLFELTVLRHCDAPLNGAAPPDIFPVVAPVAPTFARLFPLLVLSESDRVAPLPRCHTLLKFESQVLAGADWFVLIELSPEHGAKPVPVEVDAEVSFTH